MKCLCVPEPGRCSCVRPCRNSNMKKLRQDILQGIPRYKFRVENTHLAQPIFTAHSGLEAALVVLSFSFTSSCVCSRVSLCSSVLDGCSLLCARALIAGKHCLHGPHCGSILHGPLTQVCTDKSPPTHPKIRTDWHTHDLSLLSHDSNNT